MKPIIRFRTAQKSDERFLFEIRNQKSTYRYFLNTNKVTFEEHSNWLKSLMLSPKSHLVCVVDDNIAGICYLKFEEENCFVNVYIAESYSGLGLGKLLIAEVINCAKPLKIEKFIANIHRDNFSSIRTFEAIGFKKLAINNNNNVFFAYELTFDN